MMFWRLWTNLCCLYWGMMFFVHHEMYFRYPYRFNFEEQTSKKLCDCEDIKRIHTFEWSHTRYEYTSERMTNDLTIQFKYVLVLILCIQFLPVVTSLFFIIVTLYDVPYSIECMYFIFIRLRKIFCIQVWSRLQYGQHRCMLFLLKIFFSYYILEASNSYYHEFDRFTQKEHFWAMIEYLPWLCVKDVVEKRWKTEDEICAEYQSGIFILILGFVTMK